MPRVATRHAHQLAYRQRFSVGVRMFGCLMLIAGGIVLAAGVAEATKAGFSKASWLPISLGLGLAACGAILLLGERGKLIDREDKTVTRWLGIARPLWRRTRDARACRAVVVQAHGSAGWHVSLYADQAEQMELFELANRELAQAVAREVAGFLSLAVLSPAAAAVASPPPAPRPSDRWIHWRPHGRAVRILGAALLTAGGAMLLAAIGSAASHDVRGWIWLAVAAPLATLGLWQVCGGKKIEIDRKGVRVWRAWPLPPAAHDLAAFYAVIVATASEGSGGAEPETCLVGLIGPEQLRLELVGPMAVGEAREAAVRLAATANLPLIDESQPAVPSA